MITIPENKTRKKLRITLCVFYLIQIFLCTMTYVYIPDPTQESEGIYKTVFDMLGYLGGGYSDVPGGDAFMAYIPWYFVFIIIPVVGFFFCALDKQRNMKNLVSLLCCLLGVFAILKIVTLNLLSIGSLLALLLYILTSFITTYSMMARISVDPKKDENK